MIKKISKEEFEKLEFSARGTATMTFHHIHSLRAGEQLVIEASDWKRKYRPSKMCRYLEKKNPGIRYRVFTLAGKKGWAVQRIS
ncbi:MAG TPA: hypothetical protein VI757_03755 [Bacteroidia bacterium]|nr:hypothetical protein [Bacteroidia bacterium]